MYASCNKPGLFRQPSVGKPRGREGHEMKALASQDEHACIITNIWHVTSEKKIPHNININGGPPNSSSPPQLVVRLGGPKPYR